MHRITPVVKQRSRTHIVEEYEVKRRNETYRGGGMWKVNDGGIKSLDTLHSRWLR